MPTVGDVVLIGIRYHERPGSKFRPAVVLLDTGDQDFVAAPVTSQRRGEIHELELFDWRQAGLNVPSWARVHKLGVMSKVDIARHLGRLTGRDRASLDTLLCRVFCERS